MARKTPSLTMENWLALAQSDEVQRALTNDEYAAVYMHLLAAFVAMPRPLREPDAVVGVHIAYGWMPTIARPATMLTILRTRREELLEILNAARSSTSPSLTSQDAALLKTFANNSSVGASKLLHFLNPSVYPIWDSRVARNFLWRTVARETYENIDRWRGYIETIWNWSGNPMVQNTCEELRVLNVHLQTVSNTRLIELAMFHRA